MGKASDHHGAETDRTIGDLARVGVVESVDLDAGKAVVRFGDQLTPPIDWLMASGDLKIWAPPAIGEQVLVVTPEGDAEQAVIAGGLPSSVFAPLFLGEAVAIQFKDGARISYDADDGQLSIKSMGSVAVDAPNGVTITGDVTIDGDLGCNGTITGEIDVVGGGKSLKNHKHLGVTAGAAVSGKPE